MIQLAYAMGQAPGGGQGGGGWGALNLVPLLLMFAIFYFLLIRPQQKQRREHQEMLRNLKTGDEVLTNGGLYGTIVGFGDGRVKLKIADNVRVDVALSAIASKVSPGESPAKA